MFLPDSDLHIHTKFSFDSDAELRDVAEAAISAGLKTIALTDHCDIDGIFDGIYPPYEADVIRCEVEKLKSEYSGKLNILRGIELGQPHVLPKEAKKLLEEQEYEFVLGSLHNLRGYPDFYFLKFDRMEEQQLDYLAKRNIAELCEIAKFEFCGKHIDSLAHITYMSRYLDECKVDYDLLKHECEWRNLFKIMIENGIALELNYSGLRKGGRMMPDERFIELYEDCGGKNFTLGSDAHVPSDIGGVPPRADVRVSS